MCKPSHTHKQFPVMLCSPYIITSYVLLLCAGIAQQSVLSSTGNKHNMPDKLHLSRNVHDTAQHTCHMYAMSQKRARHCGSSISRQS
jgi:hypothetical protein